MRKTKIFITVLALYEFVFVSILQIQNFCVYIFNRNFCDIGFYKYFLFCIMIPILFGIILMWIPKKEEAPQNFYKNLVMGILAIMTQKIMNNKKVQKIFNDIFDIVKNVKK